MLVPIEWLNDYVKIDADTDEFCDRMIMSGSNIETVEEFGRNFEKVVVGKVLKKEKHPDADRLSVCQVDVGQEEPLQIVCGAPNVAEGMKVPVALHKSRVPGPLHGQPKVEGGVKITKGKLRGVESFGMICSCSELGFDDKVVPVAHREGIWVLPDDVEIGAPVEEALGLKSAVVDFEITPNRPDCLSMVGMAREAAATFGSQLEYPDTSLEEKGDKKASDFISVEIKNPEYCRRYTARIVTDVKIEQSPWWLQKRLMYAGMRPINNIVDITNFVMLEYGEPLHAFDIRQLEGGKIVVSTAEKGEKFTTLDGEERTLDEDMLMIRDGSKSVAVAGVMGGLNSEIQEDTTTILIEAANFDADNVRLTSKKLGLRTEASSRYEKGVDPGLCRTASDRVCKLIEMLGAGTVQPGIVDSYPQPVSPWTIAVRVPRINKVLGIDLSAAEMTDIFESLEMKVEGDGDVLQVTPPTVRLDMVAEVDFIEEVARMYGYDKLPVTLPKGNNESSLGRKETVRRMARSAMCAMGANEIQTYSFLSPRDADRIRLDENSWERNYVVIKNPLGEENSVMRTLLTPAMLETLGRNWSRNIDRVKAFEIGNTFSVNIMEPKGLPDEQDSMCIGMYGEGIDFFTLKGMVVEMLTKLGISDVKFVPESEYGPYHPGRCARIVCGGGGEQKDLKELLENANKEIKGTEEEMFMMRDMVNRMTANMQGQGIELGIMGEIHPDVADEYGIGRRCYVCELMFAEIEEMAHTEVAYTPLPKYPATSRDIALLIDEDVAVGDIEEAIRKSGGDLLESVELFDIYRGEQVEDGKKSVAFTLTYRDREKTLTDEEVVPVHEKVLGALKDEFNATLREV
ncbi:MAG: phenylalanine--tRNA ligase subunit beta [Anaerovoracaceae bacterium]|jgi:phenylalanyl-tRNA synthetase beta chain